jgi:osmotically-inducible protein OsmY
MRRQLYSVPLLIAALLTPAQAAVVSGNQISDQALGREVYQRIDRAWGGTTASLTVAVEGGLVVLSGEAPSAPAARQASDIAEATPGVVEVINRLQPQEVYEN